MRFTLGKYIEILEKQDKGRVIKKGLGNPHSWRGIYDEVAFEVVENVTIAQMILFAEDALDHTFEAWKGGDYTYDKNTPMHIELAEGSYSDGLCSMSLLFELMFQD